jgi:hypothetical protein
MVCWWYLFAHATNLIHTHVLTSSFFEASLLLSRFLFASPNTTTSFNQSLKIHISTRADDEEEDEEDAPRGEARTKPKRGVVLSPRPRCGSRLGRGVRVHACL